MNVKKAYCEITDCKSYGNYVSFFVYLYLFEIFSYSVFPVVFPQLLHTCLDIFKETILYFFKKIFPKSTKYKIEFTFFLGSNENCFLCYCFINSMRTSIWLTFLLLLKTHICGSIKKRTLFLFCRKFLINRRIRNNV